VAAMAADLYMPGSGDAIMQANQGIQSAHKSGRKAIRDIDGLVKKNIRHGKNVAQTFKNDVNTTRTNIRNDVDSIRGNLKNMRTNFTKAMPKPPDVLMQN